MRKQLLYLTNNRMTARMWHRGYLSDEQSFENDEFGWHNLSNYLLQNKFVPVQLLIDLVEEDFQRDTIPHVFGQSRKALIERRLLQYYRDTPLRHASFQGREKEGRRDDRMLFNALTNAPFFKPWIDAILKVQVPLAGIFSTALLSNALLHRLKLGSGPVLFITRQSAGLRQSYFQDGYLRFSRLTQLSAQDLDNFVEVEKLEIGKTRQFLANTRLLQRGETLNIAILDNSANLAAMQGANIDSAAAAYRYLDLDSTARSLGFRWLAGMSVSDTLYLALLYRQAPASHYTLFEQSRAYLMWQLRLALYLLSGVTLAASLVLCGLNTMEVFEASTQRSVLGRDTEINQKLYEGIVKNTPTTVAKPHDMKSAVDLEQMIAQNAPTPKHIMGVISQALEPLPQINLKEMNWAVSASNDSDDAGATGQTQSTTGQPSAALIGVPGKPIETVVIKGEVLAFQADYRTALESVHQFSENLMKHEKMQVSITRSPLDIRPSVALIGQAGNIKADDNGMTNTEFELKLVWRP